MSTDPLRLVRRAARGAPTVVPPATDWAALEQAVLAEITRRPRRSERLVLGFERLADLADRNEARGRADRLRGSWLAYLGRYEESVAPYEAAAERLRGRARDGARLGLAGSWLRLGRFAPAIELCRRIRRNAVRRGDDAVAGIADLNAGVALHESGRPDSAIPVYSRARERLLVAGHPLAATATQNLANALTLLDRYAEAALHYETAARELEGLGAGNEAARCRYNRGTLLVATERLGEAEEVLREAEEAFRAAGDPAHSALCRLDRGEALLRAGLVPEARHALASARRRLGRRAPPAERARAALLLARAHVLAGDGGAAMRVLGRDLPLDSPAVAAEREELRGRADAAEGRVGAARDRLENAARTYGVRHPASRGRALAAAAFCALETGDLAGARRLSVRSSRDAERTGRPALAHAAAAVRFLVEDRAGRRTPAQTALDSALDALERVREGLGPDAMRASVLRGREGFFARAVRHALAGPGGAEEALRLVERWRARALVDLLGEADRVAPRDERVATLRGRVAALERRSDEQPAPAWLRSGESARPAALRRLAAAERELETASGLALRAAASAPISPERIRRELPPGTLVLSLHADEEGVLLFLLSSDGISVATHPIPVRRLASLVDELHFHLGQFTVGDDFAARHRARLDRATHRLLAELSDATLAPVARAIGACRRLVVVPHGPWHRVPFAALPFGGGPLVSTVPVVLTPAVGALAGSLPRARGRSVVLAVSDEETPEVHREADRVVAALGRCRRLDGEAATAAALSGPAPRCLHVASHGRYRTDCPGMSGVRLADGWLRAVDFPSLDLRGSLVVLSGCETGVSAVGPGDEVRGLVRGVFAAGATDLVASLWRVDDAATARLLGRFHEARRSGSPPERALALAQRELAGEGAHPFYWAGFSAWTRQLRS